MVTVPLQKSLFTRRWSQQVHATRKEIDLHVELVAVLRLVLKPTVLWWHTPNGEHRDPKTAAKLKAMGVLPGVPDLQFHWCEMGGVGEFAGIVGEVRKVLHMEMKAGNRPQGNAQIAFELAVKLLGDEYHIVRTVVDALEILGERGLIKEGVEIAGRRW